jgi:phosphoribosyl-ATP pyrophosphohydrolase/phosphoribosyl-AMP cyclohydrolase/histidinol dehydrogenase
VAAEAADLLYFAMVRCVAAGVSIADVEACLDRRALKVSRRPGNSKPERIAAAAAILGE